MHVVKEFAGELYEATVQSDNAEKGEEFIAKCRISLKIQYGRRLLSVFGSGRQGVKKLSHKVGVMGTKGHTLAMPLQVHLCVEGCGSI